MGLRTHPMVGVGQAATGPVTPPRNIIISSNASGGKRAPEVGTRTSSVCNGSADEEATPYGGSIESGDICDCPDTAHISDPEQRKTAVLPSGDCYYIKRACYPA